MDSPSFLTRNDTSHWQSHHRAWEHLEAAGEASSGKGGAPTAVLFMRFKVCLQRGDAATASQQLVGLQACPDYSPAILEVGKHMGLSGRMCALTANEHTLQVAMSS